MVPVPGCQGRGVLKYLVLRAEFCACDLVALACALLFLLTMTTDQSSTPPARWPLGVMVVCGYEQHSLPAQLEAVCKLAASHIEFYPRWSANPDPREAGRTVRDFGLEVWSAHGPWGSETWQAGRVDLAATDESARRASVDDVRRAITWLADAGGARLVVHPGVLSDESQATRRRVSLVRSLSALAPAAASHGVSLCVENMPPTCCPGSRMSDLAAIVSELGATHVGLCLDTGHANIIADAASFAREAGPWLRTTHVHDNDGTRDEHRLPGQGTVRWSEFSTALAGVGYDGVIMIECPRYLREHPDEVTDQLRQRLAELCGGPAPPTPDSLRSRPGWQPPA